MLDFKLINGLSIRSSFVCDNTYKLLNEVNTIEKDKSNDLFVSALHFRQNQDKICFQFPATSFLWLAIISFIFAFGGFVGMICSVIIPSIDLPIIIPFSIFIMFFIPGLFVLHFSLRSYGICNGYVFERSFFLPMKKYKLCDLQKIEVGTSKDQHEVIPDEALIQHNLYFKGGKIGVLSIHPDLKLLFEAIRLAAPSKVAADLWYKKYPDIDESAITKLAQHDIFYEKSDIDTSKHVYVACLKNNVRFASLFFGAIFIFGVIAFTVGINNYIVESTKLYQRVSPGIGIMLISGMFLCFCFFGPFRFRIANEGLHVSRGVSWSVYEWNNLSLGVNKKGWYEIQDSKSGRKFQFPANMDDFNTFLGRLKSRISTCDIDGADPHSDHLHV